MDQKDMASMGGKARAKKLSKSRRIEIAHQAATKRWTKESAPKAETPRGRKRIVDKKAPRKKK